MSDTVVCGLDLGQVRDRTALAALNVRHGGGPGLNVYRLLFLERFHLGTPYPEIGKRLASIFAASPLTGSVLAIDGTGVGRGVIDFFKQQSINADQRPVAITGGMQAARGEDGWWHIAKTNLVSTATIVSETRRIEFAPDLPDLPVLKHELASFQVKISKAANELYEAREGEHDDLVLAVAMALWFGENTCSFGPWDTSERPGQRNPMMDAPEGVWRTP